MKTQYCKINKNGCILISKQEAFDNKEDNIYYLDNVKDEVETRARDDDIELKDFFVLDLDIRSNMGDCTDDDIKQEGINLSESLAEQDEYFGEWSKIVFSGNGLHLYYKGTPKSFDKKDYSLAVKRIYRQWDIMMGDKTFDCDHACSNLARILRLPGSINQKNGALVEIIAEQDVESRLFNMIDKFAKAEKSEKETEDKKRKKEAEERIKNFQEGDENFYESINNIPAYEFAMKILPEFPFDGKKNFRNKKGGLTGYFYVKDTNTICNGGSRYFDWGNSDSCWNNFSMIKHEYGFTDAETFLFFKNILGK